MNDTAVSNDEQIRSFAASVRAHLDDLPSDELDEILSGLTADLADQAADNDGVLELGDPAEYADELRSAAGIPPRANAGARPTLTERLRARRRRILDGIRTRVSGRWLLDLFGSLRPVWWVLRGFGIYAAITALIAIMPPFSYGPNDRWAIPGAPAQWLLLLGFVIVSVQWGRGRWLPKNGLRHVRTAASIVAVLLLPAVIGAVITPRVEYVSEGGYIEQGLRLDGVQINNIFAYDADGNPIDRVQLFTGKGTPLDLYGESSDQIQVQLTEDGEETVFGLQDDGLRVTLPVEDYRGKPVWNIYPLDEADLDQANFRPKTSTTKQPEPPFLKAQSIDVSIPTPSPTPTLGPVPQPTESPTP